MSLQGEQHYLPVGGATPGVIGLRLEEFMAQHTHRIQKETSTTRLSRARAFVIAVTVVTVIAIAPVSAQRILIRVWDLQPHSANTEEAIDQISAWLEEGYLPVGLEYEPGRPVMVLYTQNLNVPISEVTLYTVENLENLGVEMATILRDGLVPMGMARHDEGLTLLLVRTPIPIRNWGLVTVPFNLVDIEREIDRREEQGYAAWAVSDYEDEAWLLFLQESEGAPPRSASVQSYLFNSDNYIPGIDSATSQLLAPWGITANPENLYVMYTSTEE